METEDTTSQEIKTAQEPDVVLAAEISFKIRVGVDDPNRKAGDILNQLPLKMRASTVFFLQLKESLLTYVEKQDDRVEGEERLDPDELLTRIVLRQMLTTIGQDVDERLLLDSIPSKYLDSDRGTPHLLLSRGIRAAFDDLKENHTSQEGEEG